MPYVIKKLAQLLLMPVSLMYMALVAGLMMLLFKRTRRAGKWILTIGVVLAFVLGWGTFNGALERLEKRYPPFPVEDQAFCESLRGAHIIVLGQGLYASSLPIRFRDNDCFRNRMNEGARVCHAIPDSRLVVSMGGEVTEDDNQAAIDEYVRMYGFETNRVVHFSHAHDTAEEAAASLALAGTNRLVLVTSASHMERAMRIFAKRGATPVPAPCDYRYFGEGTRWTLHSIPFGSYNFLRTERLFHEYLGLIHEAFF